MKLDLDKVKSNLAAVHAAEEKLADRGPIKVLPRPSGDIPDPVALNARIAELQKGLRVVRAYAGEKGHDVGRGYDLKAIGVIDDLKVVEKGQDTAIPDATVLVRVAFPRGEHLWFDPKDLDHVSEKKKP